MNLKFYLRGLGIGIIVTAVIMLILCYQNSNNLSDAEIKQRAAALGMVEESETLSALVKDESDKEVVEPVVAEPAVSEPKADDEAEVSAKPETSVEPEAAVEPEVVAEPEEVTEPEDSSQSGGDTSNEQGEGLSEEKLNEIEQMVDDANEYLESREDGDTKPSNSSEEISSGKIYTLSVGKGENSYDIAKNLEKMGLIKDAAAFDTYLCKEKIDTKIYSGKYDIPEGSSEEEVARIITGSR